MHIPLNMQLKLRGVSGVRGVRGVSRRFVAFETIAEMAARSKWLVHFSGRL